MSEILDGDCLEILPTLDSDSIDLIVTDPPYGYSFMGKDWDKAVPSVEVWEECLRVLKPGAFMCVMSAPRSDVQNAMISRIMEAGFRMDFTPIYWTYASGFPKAGNIGKLVDKRLGMEREVVGQSKAGKSAMGQGSGWNNHTNRTDLEITKGSSSLEGSYAGFQPKPAVEVILVAMKPLSEKIYVDQALKNGKGISWLDDARIPTDNKTIFPAGVVSDTEQVYGMGKGRYEDKPRPPDNHTTGRFPANLLVSDDVLNDGATTKSTGGLTQRGEMFGSGSAEVFNYGDSGSYSRYFDLDKWASTLPFLIVPKASKGEKNKGLDGLEAIHPTVKPLKLMSYLITLFSREGDTVLDPFVGSGTTCLAAKKLARKYIGIERDSEYIEIARARLDDKQGVLL